jgi:hypothetical protein
MHGSTRHHGNKHGLMNKVIHVGIHNRGWDYNAMNGGIDGELDR